MSKSDLLPLKYKYTKSIFAASQKKEDGKDDKSKQTPKSYKYKKEQTEERKGSININPFDKSVDLQYPLSKGGNVAASINPFDVNASYTTKSGNKYDAYYDKQNKTITLGARININKKKK